MNPNLALLLAYLTYTGVSVALTIYLARTLFKNGEVFLEEVFPDRPRMASAVNRLLVIGFYLLNLGYAFLSLKADQGIPDALAAIELLATKVGRLLISLGVLHFCNLLVLHRMRRRGQLHLAPPPVAPQLRRPIAVGL